MSYICANCKEKIAHYNQHYFTGENSRFTCQKKAQPMTDHTPLLFDRIKCPDCGNNIPTNGPYLMPCHCKYTDHAPELEYNHNVVKQYGYTVDVLNITPEEAIKHCGDETKRTGRLHLWSHVDNVIVIKSVPNHIYDLLKERDHMAETNKKLVEAVNVAKHYIENNTRPDVTGERNAVYNIIDQALAAAKGVKE